MAVLQAGRPHLQVSELETGKQCDLISFAGSDLLLSLNTFKISNILPLLNCPAPKHPLTFWIEERRSENTKGFESGRGRNTEFEIKEA